MSFVTIKLYRNKLAKLLLEFTGCCGGAIWTWNLPPVDWDTNKWRRVKRIKRMKKRNGQWAWKIYSPRSGLICLTAVTIERPLPCFFQAVHTLWLQGLVYFNIPWWRGPLFIVLSREKKNNRMLRDVGVYFFGTGELPSRQLPRCNSSRVIERKI